MGRRGEVAKDSHGRPSHLPVFLLASEKGGGKEGPAGKMPRTERWFRVCSLLRVLAGLVRCRGRGWERAQQRGVNAPGTRTTQEMLVTQRALPSLQ